MGKISLRAAVQQANFSGVLGGPSVWIRFDPAVFGNVQTINLTQKMDTLSKSIAIQGTGKDMLFINGGGTAGVFSIQPGSVSLISNLTLQNCINRAVQGSGLGGAIENHGVLVLDSLRISGCTADEGGAIYNDNNLTILGCQIIDNHATMTGGGVLGYGGGIAARGGLVSVSGSEVRGCTADGRGGGLSLRQTAKIELTDTIVIGNFGTYGGGVYNSGGTFMMTNGQLAENTATVKDGGGIFHSGGKTYFAGVTLRDNTAAGRGGAADVRNGTFVLRDCSFAGNQASPGRGPKVAAGVAITAINCQGFDPTTDIYTGT